MSASAHDKVRVARETAYREVVLEAAEAVFAERGFAGAKMADIAAAAGISLGTLYKVFPGKSALHGAIHGWRANDIMRWSTPEMPLGADLVEAMLAGVRGYTRFQIAHPNYLRLTLGEVTTWTNATALNLPEQVQAWNSGFALAVQVFTEGIEAGDFVREPPELHARTMIAILQVVLAHWVQTDMQAPGDEVVRRVEQATLRAFATPSTRLRYPDLLEP